LIFAKIATAKDTKKNKSAKQDPSNRFAEIVEGTEQRQESGYTIQLLTQATTIQMLPASHICNNLKGKENGN
tara:strand:+ start:708 stop:923 length:216 start_codon:yes stop_codon:yes gene_type:complete